MARKPMMGRVGQMDSDSGRPEMLGSLSFAPNQRDVNHSKTLGQVNNYATAKQMLEYDGQGSAGMRGPYSQTLG